MVWRYTHREPNTISSAPHPWFAETGLPDSPLLRFLILHMLYWWRLHKVDDNFLDFLFVIELQRNRTQYWIFLARLRFDYKNLGSHCLDLLHRSYTGISEVEHYEGELCSKMRPASYLHEASVSFRLSEGHLIHNMNFQKGKLKLSKIHIHGEMDVFVVNMISYEQLCKTFGYFSYHISFPLTI